MKRKVWIDAAKGLGMVFVLLSHLGLLQPCDTFLSCFMAIFYFLSGYLYHSNEKMKQGLFSAFIKKKAERIMYPYFLWGVTLAIFCSFILGFDSKFFYGLLIGKYILGSFNSITMVLWFFPSFFLSNVLFYIFVTEQSSKRRKYLLIFGTIWTLFLSYFHILLPWSFEHLFVCACLMYLGHEVSDKLDSWSWHNVIACVFLYVLIASFNGHTNLSVSIFGSHKLISPFLYVIEGTLFSIIVLYVLHYMKATLLVSLLSIIGRHSIRIMCLHLLVFFFLHKYTSLCGIVVFSLTLLICICLSLLLNTIEKTKYGSLLQFTR